MSEAKESREVCVWPPSSHGPHRYAIYVTGEGEALGIAVNGLVIVRTPEEWHRLAAPPLPEQPQGEPCGYCGTPTERSFPYCPYCGATNRQWSPARAAASATAPDRMREMMRDAKPPSPEQVASRLAEFVTTTGNSEAKDQASSGPAGDQAVKPADVASVDSRKAHHDLPPEVVVKIWRALAWLVDLKNLKQLIADADAGIAPPISEATRSRYSLNKVMAWNYAREALQAADYLPHEVEQVTRALLNEAKP